jgi:ankyrin repeat protein
MSDARLEINQQNKSGVSALMRAVEEKHKEIVEILLGHENVNVNFRDEHGSTALITATTF